MNDSVSKYFQNLPKPIQTGPNLAVPIGGRHGVCASFHSPDDLDTQALAHLNHLVETSNSVPVAADIGSSPFAPQAIRFAEAGAVCDAFDLEAAHPEIKTISDMLNSRLTYYCCDFSTLKSLPSERQYNLIYANRFFSHLPYSRAQAVLRMFVRQSAAGAKFFFTFSSLDSTLAENYPHTDLPVAERFAIAVNPRTTQNQLQSPLCLYRPTEVESLLKDAGLTVDSLFVSGSGNIKSVASLSSICAPLGS